MIVDTYTQNGDIHVYARHRDENGEVVEQHDQSFKPYFYVPRDVVEKGYRVEMIIEQFRGSSVEPDTVYHAMDGTELRKIFARHPGDLPKMRQMLNSTYEADLRFKDRWLIDSIQEMPTWKPRKWWYDIECDTGDDSFTTVIAIIDSDLDTPVVFAWADESTNCPYPLTGRSRELIQRKVRDVEYELHLCFSERQLHENFIDFLQERDPDMLIAHAGTFFDIPHLIERIDRPERMSPVGQIRRVKRGEDRYDYTDQPIVGRWQFDTAAPARSGSGFERVWKDSGGGQLPSLKLNDIAEELGLGSKLTEEIEGMDIHNGWREYWTEFVDYCLLDTVLLRGIDESRNVTDFYVEMVRLCGVSIESAANVTNFARGLLHRRTDRKVNTRYRPDEDFKLQGAEVGLELVTGLHEGVAILDYKGLYPSLITGHNLSYETKREGPGPGIKMLSNGTYWDQTEKGLLPQVVDYLFEYRAICKSHMKNAKSAEERSAWNTTQSAVKRVMASLYGMTAHIGFGWADPDIATAITSEGRRCIKLLADVAAREGYETLYGHTDSAFVKVASVEEAQEVASKITDEVQRVTGNEQLIAELETWMSRWLLVKKNRYVGKVDWPEEDSGKLKVAGFEMKASSAAPLSKKLQREVFAMICDGVDEQKVRSHILTHVNAIKDKTVELKEISKTTRLSMPIEEYKTLSGASKAAAFYNNHIARSREEEFGKGDNVKWTYVTDIPRNLPPTDVVAYHEAEDISHLPLDNDTIVNKMIRAVITSAFTTLGWDVGAAVGEVRARRYW